METSITWNSEDKEWRVWTDNPAHAAKIERNFGIKPYRTAVQEGYTPGKFYCLPAGRYRPFVAKRILSDDEREARASVLQGARGLGEKSARINDSDELVSEYQYDDYDDSGAAGVMVAALAKNFDE